MADHRRGIERFLLREWQTPSAAQLILRPLSLVYAALAAVHRCWHKMRSMPERLRAPVIVVGNLTVGGTGKTPLVLALVAALRQRGWHPGVILRGYRSGSGDDGDEAALIRQRVACPVVAGSDRWRAARTLLATNPEVDVVISDDGLQHHALPRQCEIVVIDGERGLGNGQLLPAGPLREPRTRLQTVDAIVGNGGFQQPPDSAVPRFTMQIKGECLVNVVSGEQLAADAFIKRMNGRSIHAVAGIGHPERFFRTLAGLGIAATPHAFTDHHTFSANDLAMGEGVIVVMTQKDAVRLAALAQPEHWYLAVDAIVPDSLFDLVQSTLSKAIHG
jgi:tetraacyldisaccharide 4'-kinase